MLGSALTSLLLSPFQTQHQLGAPLFLGIGPPKMASVLLLVNLLDAKGVRPGCAHFSSYLSLFQGTANENHTFWEVS